MTPGRGIDGGGGEGWAGWHEGVGANCARGSWGLRLGRPANRAVSQKVKAMRGRQKLRTGREVEQNVGAFGEEGCQLSGGMRILGAGSRLKRKGGDGVPHWIHVCPESRGRDPFSSHGSLYLSTSLLSFSLPLWMP